MWRSQPVVASSFTFKPMQRSNSESSLQSWTAVSDVSWEDIESKASECGWQEVVSEQLPSLTAAEPSGLSKADIGEVRALKSPPAGVKLTMEVICILLQVPPRKLVNGGLDFWESSTKLLGDPAFLSKVFALRTYVPPGALEAAAPYMSREDFTPNAVRSVSAACAGLCKWAREVYKYHVLDHASAAEAWAQYTSKPADFFVTDSDAAFMLVDKAIQELKSLAKPPAGVDRVCECFLHLFAGLSPDVEITPKGNVKDTSWKGCKKFFSDPAKSCLLMKDFKGLIDAGSVPRRNIQRVRRVQVGMGSSFSAEAMRAKSAAAAALISWLQSTVAYFCAAAPNRLEEKAPTIKSGVVADSSDTMPSASFLNKGDITEIKCLHKPPQDVVLVCVCVCVLRPLGTEDADAGWAGAKAMLLDPRLLKALMDYEKDNVTEAQIARIRELLKQIPAVQEMGQVSKAACGLLKWVLSVVDHYDILKGGGSDSHC